MGVMASALEHGLWSQQQKVIGALCGNLPSHVASRNSNYVIEAALDHCLQGRSQLVDKFVHGGTELSAALQLCKLRSVIDLVCQGTELSVALQPVKQSKGNVKSGGKAIKRQSKGNQPVKQSKGIQPVRQSTCR